MAGREPELGSRFHLGSVKERVRLGNAELARYAIPQGVFLCTPSGFLSKDLKTKEAKLKPAQIIAAASIR